MYAVFFLLVIFCAATLVARLSHRSLFLRFLIAPGFVALGHISSSSVLGLIREPTLNSLDFFIQIAIAWLGFLLGFRKFAFSRTTLFKRKFLLAWQLLLTLGLVFIFTLTFFYFLNIPELAQDKWLFYALCFFISSLLLGRSLLSFKPLHINSFHDAIIAVLGLSLFSFALLYQQNQSITYSLLLLASGFGFPILANILWLLVAEKEDCPKETLVLCLISLCTLLAGVANFIGIPHLILTFIFGLILSFYTKSLGTISRQLFLSEQAVRIVIMIFIGAQLSFSKNPIFAGILFGLILSFARFSVLGSLRKNKKKRRMFSFFMASSEICMPVAVSMWLVFTNLQPQLNNLVVFILCASSTGDLFGVLRWWLMGKIKKTKIKLVTPSPENL